VRVLAVIPGTGQGASFIFARRQVESLKKPGFAVQVHYLNLQASPRGLWDAWRGLKQIIESYSPDIVHVFYGTITSFLCAVSSRRPLVITFQGSDLNPDPTMHWSRTWIGILLSQISTVRAAAVICVSRQLRDRLWWKGKQAVVLPTGIDMSLFEPCEKTESRRSLGWQADERVALINVGSAPLLKGLPLARQAVAIAEKKLGMAIRLALLEGNVTPNGVPTYLNAADCLLIASESEGSPNVLKEALACNLPVASVNVGDCAQRLAGVWPSQVVTRDAESLGQALYEILKMPQRSNGREMIQDCSEEKIAETLSEIYRSVCNHVNPLKVHVPSSTPSES
jgi:teichuronic acid biosynthesis glycosyltransferase TuaC